MTRYYAYRRLFFSSASATGYRHAPALAGDRHDNFRLYFLTKAGGHIERYEAIEAKGDGAAIEAAKLYRGRYSLELWQRDRRVEAFPAQRGLVPAPYGH